MSGERALELIGQKLQVEEAVDAVLSPFKLILCDYSMPRMSGPETVRRMNRLFEEFQEANPEITLFIPYICCLTAYSGKE